MIRLRKECPEIGWGSWSLLDTDSTHVLAMQYTWRNDSIVIVHNFAGRPINVFLRVEGSGSELLVDLRVVADSHADARGRHELSLDAFGYRWFRVGRALASARVREPGERAVRRRR